MHSDATEGFLKEGPPDPTSLTGGLILLGIHTNEQQISDHYVDIAPDPAIGYCPLPSPFGPSFLLQDHTTPVVRAVIRQPVVAWQAGAAQRAFDLRQTPVTELVISSQIGGIAALQDNGIAVALGNNGGPCTGQSVGPGLVSDFGGSLVWVSAVEPNPSIGGIDGRVIALAISPDGTTLVDEAIDFNGRAAAATEVDGVGSVGLGVVHAVTPSPRQGFASIFSRAAAGLYVLGGTDAVTHATLNDMWFLPLLGGDWARLTFSSYTPGQILAGTYSFGDQNLWVLDGLTDANGFKWLRLARLARTGGAASVVGTWPDLGIFNRWFLTVDRDGGVLLAGSNDLGSSTVRFSIASEPPLPSGLLLVPGALAYRPIVDPHTYAFVRWNLDGSIGTARSAQFTTFGLSDGCQFTPSILLSDLAHIF